MAFKFVCFRVLTFTYSLLPNHGISTISHLPEMVSFFQKSNTTCGIWNMACIKASLCLLTVSKVTADKMNYAGEGRGFQSMVSVHLHWQASQKTFRVDIMERTVAGSETRLRWSIVSFLKCVVNFPKRPRAKLPNLVKITPKTTKLWFHLFLLTSWFMLLIKFNNLHKIYFVSLAYICLFQIQAPFSPYLLS